MDNIQQIADAVEKGRQLIVWASVPQGSTGLRRLRIDLCSDSFHAVLALSCGLAKCQCCITTVMVVVYCGLSDKTIHRPRQFFLRLSRLLTTV